MKKIFDLLIKHKIKIIIHLAAQAGVRHSLKNQWIMLKIILLLQLT